MEYQTITNLLGNIPDRVPKFITKKCIEVRDKSDRYKPNKQIRLKTSMLKSDLCDYSDAYVVAKGTATVTGANDRDRKNRFLAFKNNTSYAYQRSIMY